MESKHKQKEKRIGNIPPKIYKEQTFSNIKSDLLKKKTKRTINIKRKSKRSKSKNSSKIVEINTTDKDFSNLIEIESSNSERETSLNPKKIIGSNFIKTKNINIDEKQEKIIDLDEKEENSDIDFEEVIPKNKAEKLLKNNITKFQMAINSSKEKRNNKFKIKNSSQISINKEKTNNKKKERKIYQIEKEEFKNNIKPIKINSNEEIISIDDEEESKSSKITKKHKNEKKSYSNQKAKTKPSNINEEEDELKDKNRNRFIISKKNTIFTSEQKESLFEEEYLNSFNTSNKSVNYKETNYNEVNERKKFGKHERRNMSLEKEKYISYNSENTNNNNKKTKLFIWNIDYKTKINDLSNLFKSYGDIKKIKIFKNNKGKSKGRGFVEFKNPESAVSAKKNINQKEFRGRKLKLEFWKSKIDQKFEEFKRELEKKLMETNKNVGILTEIYIQSEKYINNYMKKTINNINMKLNCVINAFKV